MINKKYWNYILVIIYILIPIVIFIIPVDVIENGESVCIYKRLLHKECWGCGTTRAFFNIIHFNLKKAYEFNKLSPITFSLCVFVYVKSFMRTINKMKS